MNCVAHPSENLIQEVAEFLVEAIPHLCVFKHTDMITEADFNGHNPLHVLTLSVDHFKDFIRLLVVKAC